MSTRETDPYLDLIKKALTGYLYEESAWTVVAPRSAIRRFFIRQLEKRSLLLVRTRPFEPERRALGRDWPGMAAYTMIGLRRLDNIQECIESIERDDVPGDLLEAGAWRGGASIFMRACLKQHASSRQVWVADSFEGLPTPSREEDAGHDYSGIPYLAVSLEAVKGNFERFGLLDDQVHFLEGWFADTLHRAPIEQLALLRLDGDLYESTMDALTACYHKVSPGGFVIIDDYVRWKPCRRAVTEFREQHGITATIKEIDRDGVYWRVGE